MAILLIGPAAVWLLWAENEYRGLDSCPWGAHQGHPVLVGLGLSVLASAIMIWRGWTNDRVKAVCFGLVVGVLAGLAVAVVAVFSGAGLRCTD